MGLSVFQNAPTLITALISTILLAAARCDAIEPWMNRDIPPSQRADILLQEMNITEKIQMLHGCDGPYVGNTAAQARLNIPALYLNDGPQGFRVDSHPGTTTCFPSGINIGATWDVDLASLWGSAMGEEFRLKGANVQLGPGVNVHRVPLCGRNFEYVSGGDPFLGYTLIQPVVRGIQAAGVIATVKHYVQNNQETDRGDVNEIVDDRTRHEIYYPPFLGAVEAGVGAFMCSYNKINGAWSCENPDTLGDLKRNTSEGGMGFAGGWVMSDWGGTHSLSIEAGLDQEMPSSNYFGPTLASAVLNGTIKMSVVDNAVHRVLTSMFSVGLFDRPVDPSHNISSNVTSEEHNKLARKLAASSHILLKNTDNLLPLDISTPRKIVLVGGAAFEPITSGGGSGGVFPAYVVTPYEGLFGALGMHPEPTRCACNASAYIANMSIYQFGCQSYPAASVEECSQQCARYVNCNAFTYDPGNCNLYPTMQPLQPSPGSVTGACKKTRPSTAWTCNANSVCAAAIDGTDIEATAELVKEADVAIVVIATFSGEGRDRYNLTFDAGAPGWARCQLVPPGQDNLVSVVAATGTKTVVAMVAPGAVLTPWRNDVHAILHGLMPGQVCVA